MTSVKDRLIKVIGNFLFAIALLLFACLIPLSVSSYSDDSSENYRIEISDTEVLSADDLIEPLSEILD
jgi:hypothetical protein